MNLMGFYVVDRIKRHNSEDCTYFFCNKWPKKLGNIYKKKPAAYVQSIFTVFLLLCWLYWLLYSQFWAQRGVRIVTWTVNDGREKDYFKLLGVPFMTDTLETWSHAWLFLICQFSYKVRNITIIRNQALNFYNDSWRGSKYLSRELSKEHIHVCMCCTYKKFLDQLFTNKMWEVHIRVAGSLVCWKFFTSNLNAVYILQCINCYTCLFILREWSHMQFLKKREQWRTSRLTTSTKKTKINIRKNPLKFYISIMLAA